MPELTPNEMTALVTDLSVALKEIKGVDFTEVKNLVGKLPAEKIVLVEKALKLFDEREEKNSALVVEVEKHKKAVAELQEQITNLELMLSKGSFAKTQAGDEKQAEKKQEILYLNHFLKTGGRHHSDLLDGKADKHQIQIGIDQYGKPVMESKYVRTDLSPEGGFLLQGPEYLNEMLKNITEISVFRNLARVRSTIKKSASYPKRTSLISSSKGGEGSTMTESQSLYGRSEIFVHKQFVKAVVTSEALADLEWDIESELRSDVNEEFARAEGIEWFTGTGVLEAYGILNESTLQSGSRKTGLAADLAYDPIFSLTGDLKDGYTGTFLFNRLTRVLIALLKDAEGRPMPTFNYGDLSRGIPDQLFGHSYAIIPAMPDVAADAYPIAFGDWKQAYMIVDRMALEVQRDPYSQGDAGKIVFRFWRRYGGDLLKTEAAKLLKVAVS